MSLRMFIAQNGSRKDTDPFKDTYFEEYGALYNWWAVDGLAKGDWRIPSDSDFTTLETYIDTNYNTGEDDFGVSCHLKSERTEIGDPAVGIPTNEHPRWDYHEDHYGRNSVNLSALPGGNRHENNGVFNVIGSQLNWWSSTEAGESSAISKILKHDLNYVDWMAGNKSWGFSAVCLRDATTNEQDNQHQDYIPEGVVQSEMYEGHDGKKYDAVRIGTQVWITENLKETKKYEVFSDWYLPSIGELQAIYDNLHDDPDPVGDFDDLNYGSSTEYGANGWKGIYFNNGTTTLTGKMYEFQIRPIRHIISSKIYDIKDEIGGGYVFHMEDLGGGENKYYIVAKAETQEYLEFEISHGEYGTDLGTGENIGDGEGNTDLIINDVDFEGQYPAAEHCVGLQAQGDVVDIPIVTGNAEWAALETAAMCAYPK